MGGSFEDDVYRPALFAVGALFLPVAAEVDRRRFGETLGSLGESKLFGHFWIRES